VTPTPPLPSLTELFAELQAAVRAGLRDVATQLEQTILQRLATEAAARAALEQEVQALMAQLPLASSPPPRLTRSVFELQGNKLLTKNSANALADGIRYPVWFATNRQPTADGQDFTAARHHQVSRGRVDVHIPKTHRFGETGSSLLTKFIRLDFRADHLRVEQVTPLERDAFFAEITQSMADVTGEAKATQALFFLHGYNTSFEEAAIRAAQIGCDLKVQGATAFFSWPSGGTVAAYLADEAAIEASERAITDFLVDFATNCGAEKVHVIAHSMGNRGLLRALQRIAGNAETAGQVKFGQIFLAAPDVDRDLFQDLASLYPTYSERTTLYASARDLPVHLSARLHNAPRAGYFEPYTVAAQIDTVAVPNFNLDLLGHGYFAQAEALLYDIRDLMLRNQAPGERQRITKAQVAGENFWEFSR